MRYAQIRETDIANGEGIRVSIFVQGCDFKCKGCFNTPAWSFDEGKKFTTQTENDIIKLLQRPYIKGLTILGGEPMHDNNYLAVGRLIDKVKLELHEKDVWVYSGYKIEDIEKEGKLNVLKNADVLVDGLFVEELKDLSLRFRGSSNQRIIKLNNRGDWE